MGKTKWYSGTIEQFEEKLLRVMKRLGVDEDHYQCDYRESKAECVVFVEMRYHGQAYRFENSTQKSAQCGRGLTYKSDLLAEIVYSLEGLARAVEKGIFTLDMLLEGVPSLPAGHSMEPCFIAMGFTQRPETVEEVKKRYRLMAKTMHPDAGGSPGAFADLSKNYSACLELLGGSDDGE